MPKVKVGNDNRDGVAGQTTYSAHVGGGSISFDSTGDLYIGTGDDVDPFGQGGNGYAPLDQRYPQRYDARNTAANTNDLRGKILRIHPLANAAGAPASAPPTRSRPGTCSRPARRSTKPEIFAMGFRNPFTVAADPAHPGTVVVGEYGPDAGANSATRGPAGVIEWNRVTKPGFFGWPLCVGRQLGRQQLLPLHVPERPVRHALRLLGDGDPERVAQQHRPAEHPRPGRRRRRVAQAHRRASRAVRDPGPVGAAGVDHRPDLRLRRLEPVDDQVARLLRRRLVHPRPLPELVARDAREGRRQRRSCASTACSARASSATPGHSYPIPVKFGPDGALYMATWGFDCCRAQLPDQPRTAG